MPQETLANHIELPLFINRVELLSELNINIGYIFYRPLLSLITDYIILKNDECLLCDLSNLNTSSDLNWIFNLLFDYISKTSNLLYYVQENGWYYDKYDLHFDCYELKNDLKSLTHFGLVYGKKYAFGTPYDYDFESKPGDIVSPEWNYVINRYLKRYGSDQRSNCVVGSDHRSNCVVGSDPRSNIIGGPDKIHIKCNMPVRIIRRDDKYKIYNYLDLGYDNPMSDVVFTDGKEEVIIGNEFTLLELMSAYFSIKDVKFDRSKELFINADVNVDRNFSWANTSGNGSKINISVYFCCNTD